MTVLGKMLFEDGVEKGIEKGIEKGVQQGLGRANALNVKLADAGRAEMCIRDSCTSRTTICPPPFPLMRWRGPYA